MPLIAPEDGYLTVFNIFETEDRSGQETVLDEMRDIIDNADYPGWVSSTLHAGHGAPGTANFIQWESLEALEARYAAQGFQRGTVPLFQRLSTSVRLLKTEPVFTQRHPSLDRIEVSPARDDHTVIVVLSVEPENQKELLDLLAVPEPWLQGVPGYRSHTYLRGIEGDLVVNYAQWDDDESYQRFHHMPEEQRPAEVRAARARARELVTARFSNTYSVVHSRSARG